MQNHTTFRVADVERATEPIQTGDYSTILKTTFGQYIESYGVQTAQKSLYQKPEWRKEYDPYIHPFVEALHIAFGAHYGIVISPDMIWLMICHGFANHVNTNSEALRHKFVAHKGKKTIAIRRDDFIKGQQNAWENTFPEFCGEIEKHVGKDLNDLVIANFSTTGAAETAAFQVAMMDAMGKYFDYTVMSICGIPEITLTGTEQDWQWIADHITQFDEYELGWWTKELQPILTQFVKAKQGEIDIDFWNSIYKFNSGSGGSWITGWIIKFFPYLISKNNAPMHKNPYIQNPINLKGGGLGFANIPKGCAKANFIWQYHRKKFKMEFLAGFVGFSQDENLNLIPEINWVVREKKRVQGSSMENTRPEPKTFFQKMARKLYDWAGLFD
jgi:Domain of unknown function (DUF4419)